jgi:hypothetical protein
VNFSIIPIIIDLDIRAEKFPIPSARIKAAKEQNSATAHTKAR